jgi:hypothetical protein
MSSPSPEDGNRPSFQNVVFSSLSLDYPTVYKIQKLSNSFMEENVCVFMESCRWIPYDDLGSYRIVMDLLKALSYGSRKKSAANVNTFPPTRNQQ